MLILSLLFIAMLELELGKLLLYYIYIFFN
jgi:hypothetical protein